MDTLHVDLQRSLRSFSLQLSLDVGRETVALVGPSGAGKTSVLHAVAGLTRPDKGRIALGSRPWFDADVGVDLPSEQRSVGLVFQDYALFPHLTVRRNVAFGGRDRADEMLERFRISHLADARPDKLSGGERQRVALARTLARSPGALLLDEPLAALDAHTRATVRGELRTLLGDLRLPTLLVTHDFEDAATLADRVGVLVDGRILQIAPAAELVAAPADAFVASFTGANLLHGVATPGRNGLTEIVLDVGGSVWTTAPGNGPVAVVIYPWEVAIARDAPSDSAVNHIRGPISSLVGLGNRARVRVGPLTAEVTSSSVDRLALREGAVVVASFKATAARIVPFAGRPV